MKWITAILMIGVSVFAEPFDFMLLTTRQDAEMDWWYAGPEPFAPKVTPVSTVVKDEYFRILPIFRNYKTDIGKSASITFDVKITKPDGSTYLDLPKLEGHIGLTSTKELLPAQAVINLCFEPEDAYGEYRIEITAYDQVAQQTNTQHKVIQLKEFEVEKLSKDERERLFLTYPSAPNPSRALSAFLQTEEQFFNEENEPVWSAVWFFKTIFEENEYCVPLMMKEFGFCKPKQKRDIILMAVLLDQTDQLPKLSTDLKRYQRLYEAGRVPDPYSTITNAKQLDMLWAEFFATGTVKPLKQIVRSLALVEHLGTIDKIKAGELDPEDKDVARAGFLEAVFQSALWSLKSNCKEVPLVRHYCVGILATEELEKPVETCLAMLLQSLEVETPAIKEKEESNENNHHDPQSSGTHRPVQPGG